MLAQGHLGSLLLWKLLLNAEKLRLYELIAVFCLMSKRGHCHSLPHCDPICKTEASGNLILNPIPGLRASISVIPGLPC